VVAEILQVVGLALVAVAAFMVAVPLGLLVAGLSVLAVGVAFDPRLKRDDAE
jgi:hypothetical protein